MSILAGNHSRVIVQGITGSEGSFHAQQCLKYGTHVVGGVTPGKGGETIFELPVFNTVWEAVEATRCNTSLIFVPPAFASDAVLESIEAGIELIICITEGIPVQDMIKIKQALNSSSSRLIGPNCPGIITPGQAKIGIMPASIHQPGKIGVISRSGTLTYEAVKQLSDLGLGQSTCVGIGGDPVIGSSFMDLLPLFEKDPGTDAVVMIGEIGGTAEVEAASWARDHMSKPLIGYIAGKTAPKGKRMGHAGAIIQSGAETVDEKIRILRHCGCFIARTPAEIGETVKKALEGGVSRHTPGPGQLSILY
jgi:succinyl-CoA synthetase alpha subunit